MRKPIVIFHQNCMDGFASACVVARYLNGEHVEADFHAAQYGETPPDAADRDVYIVDFSYPESVMLGIATSCARFVWLDHHETSRETYEHMVSFADERGGMLLWTLQHSDEACGATMAWAHFFGRPPPRVLQYVEDRDLWRWEMDESRAASAGLAAMWRGSWACPDLAWCDFFDANVIQRALATGALLVAEQASRVKGAIKRAELVTIDGIRALATNSATDQSEVGEGLCCAETSDAGGPTFYPSVGVVYWKDASLTGTPWVHSLRSRDGTDVSVIAKARGGGGHKAAAGFRAERPITEATK